MDENLNKRIRDLLNSAISSISKGNVEDAIEELKTAEVLDNENPEILYNLGIAHSKHGLHKTAIQYYEKILSLPSSFIDSLQVKRLLAFSRILTGLFKEAQILISEIIKTGKPDIIMLSLAGYAFEKSGKIDEAIQMHEKVLNHDPDNINACNSVAYLLAIKERDLDRALTLAKKALDTDPDSAAYNDTVGYIYFKKRMNDLSKIHLKKAFEADPANEEIRTHLHALLKF